MKHSIHTAELPANCFPKTRALWNSHQDALNAYVDQLLWWNKRINLVSRNVPRETIEQHVRHSLVLASFDAFLAADFIIDTGTGGGLPGIPLAITHPKKTFLLNDIVSKKVRAVKQMSRRLGLSNVQFSDSSIADVTTDRPALLISKHAFKINELMGFAAHIPYQKIMLYKGEDFGDELDGVSPRPPIASYDLSVGGPFYKGKAIVVIG